MRRRKQQMPRGLAMRTSYFLYGLRGFLSLLLLSREFNWYCQCYGVYQGEEELKFMLLPHPGRQEANVHRVTL